MPPNRIFGQPGGLQDLDAETWDKVVSDVIGKQMLKESAHIYNPLAVSTDNSPEERKISWQAFPKNLRECQKKWALADMRENQDEYCEWEVQRENGKIVKITFTCEVPEYWEQMCEDKPDHLLQQYRFLLGNDNITIDDLRKNGKYDTKNKWNLDVQKNGDIVHLSQANNTLKDAVELVADSTILRRDQNDTLIEDQMRLLDEVASIDNKDRSKGRHSDPEIMAIVNEFVRNGKSVAITESPGVYIDNFDYAKFSVPGHDNVNIHRFWTVARGDKAKCVRAVFQVPPDLGFVVGDIVDDKSHQIDHGSRVAEHVWIRLDVQSLPHAAVSNGTNPDTDTRGDNEGQLYQYIEGRDIEPFKLDTDFIANNLEKEWFGRYLASKATKKEEALKFSDLLAQLPDHTWRAFAADEGIGLKWPQREQFRVRLVVFCTPEKSTAKPARSPPTSKVADIDELVENSFRTNTVAIVAVPPASDPTNVDSPLSSLQVASYSHELGVFHFYNRERVSAAGSRARWLFFGSSTDAFAGDTQGLGVFCGHPNGGIIMKEFENPWVHWHTDQHPLRIPDGHPLNSYDALKHNTSFNFGSGKDMATIVLKGNRAWFDKRMKLDFGDLWPQEDDLLVASIPYDTYDKARRELGLRTLHEFGKDFGSPRNPAGDREAQAPWKVLVPGIEDVEGVKRIIKSKLLSEKEVAALLMVDFWNPIFSWRRAQLMRYIPSTARWDGTKYTLGTGLTRAIRAAAAAKPDGSPEAEYVQLLDAQGDFSVNFSDKLIAFIAQVNKGLKDSRHSKDSVKNCLRVAESKRRIFRPSPWLNLPAHPLAEFNMALPYATSMPDDPSGPWEFTASGAFRQAKPSENIWHSRSAQAPFSSAGCPFSSTKETTLQRG
ncbi:hypothetical protein MMYC01_201566 [Madurella mycetomatis]|uniref:Uncharacterized protein n=1 Tax=Madurella mycetomatis TaxID=100816 RepID=A0A175WG83_9PEZI|nr:hypothetical protein MMYC01_201566 [Madurella mycetomatis]